MAIDGLGSALNIGVQGFQNAQNRANQAAQDIASLSVSDVSSEGIDNNNLISSLVDLNVAELDAQANAKVIETAADVLGTLLDIEV